MALIQLFKSGEKTAVLFDLVKKALDQVPLLVPMTVIFAGLLAVLAGWDHRFSWFVCNQLQEAFRVVRTVGNDPLKIQLRNQAIRLGDVMPLPTCQQKAQRVAQGIYAGVDLGAEPAPAASERLAFLATGFF